MTNAKRYIINVNPYDYILRIQEALNELDEESVLCPCVIDMLTGKDAVCKSGSCADCLQEWFNEDETASKYYCDSMLEEIQKECDEAIKNVLKKYGIDSNLQ